MMKWASHIVLFSLSFFTFGQELNTGIDKDHVKTGEPFNVTYSISSNHAFDSIQYTPQTSVFKAQSSAVDKGEKISSPYELEIASPFKDTSYQEKGKYIWKGTYRLMGWDSAFVVIPPEGIYIDDSLQRFPAGLIQIASPKADPSKPLYDIHEEFTEIDPNKDGFLSFIKANWWWLAILLAIVVVLLIYLKKRNKKEAPVLSLRQETLQRIDKLEKGKGYESNLKEYYFDLSILLRRFFTAHYQERMLDKTTSEIEALLKKQGLDQNMILLTRQLLTQSDMVKFAKSTPPLHEIQQITNHARRIVNEVADLDLENE